MKKGITLLPLFIAALFLSNMAFAGGPDLKAKPEPASPWMVYTGLFTGNYNAVYQYGGNYYSTNSGFAPIRLGNLIFNNVVSQEGESAGIQLGTQFHLQSPYYLGVVLSGMANSNKGVLTSHVDDGVSVLLPYDLTYEFRVLYNINLAAVIGTDITPHTHLYAKAGTSYARSLVKLLVSNSSVSPYPILSSRLVQHLGLWGWLFGVGLTHDINKWVSVFAEYDYYDYGNPNLNANDNLAPGLTASVQERLTHHVTMTANSILLGLNLKFRDNFSPFHYLGAISPWMVYVGPFFGNYSADYDYNATYFSNSGNATSPANHLYNEEAAQKSVSLGAQIGVQYHLQSPGYFGIVFSSMMNADKARLEEHVENVTAAVNQSAFVMNNEFYINYNLDLAAVIGADVTPHTHIYVKAGASNAQLRHHSFVTGSRSFPIPIPTHSESDRENIWGWIVGLGLTYDFSKWLSAFIEYDHYDYGHHNLKPLYDLDPNIFIMGGGIVDNLEQNVHVKVNAVHLGLNIKLMDTYSAIRYLRQTTPWIVYLGASGGYYDAHYQFGGTYFSNRGPTTHNNQILTSDVVQREASAGAQIGFQYHLNNPYFVGVVITSMFNANKARLTEDIENGVSGSAIQLDLNYQFRIHYNLDMAALFGADITPKTHIYVKAGTSYGRLSVNFFTTASTVNAFPTPVFEQLQHLNVFGWLAGLGLTRDINKRVSAFVEYDYYDYGLHNLIPFNRIAPILTAAQTDHLVHHVAVTANSVRLGLNVNFAV